MKSAFRNTLAIIAILCLPFAPNAQTVSYQRNNSFTNWESPQVHPLDLTPDGTRLLAVNTANNTLEIFNVAVSGQAPSFIRSVPVGVDPVTVRARTNTEAWVVNVISDSVSIVDLQNGIVTATLQADDEPADVIFAGSSQGSAFVSCAQAKTLMIFNALAPLSAAPVRVPINGEQPRALASSANGRYVYLAIFESGNATTILPGGITNGSEHDVVRDPSGPYGGVNAPPNAGSGFNPPLNPSNPAPIPVSLIVRKVLSGKWVDDNGVDWSAFVTGSKARTGTPGDRVAGWDLPDRDVAIIDTQNSNAVTYQTGLMNMVMSIGVNPANGQVTVVGTDSTNQIRYEPVLQSTFVHVEGASFTPGSTSTIFDLNPHITYKVKSVPMAQRLLSIGDPRGIVWNAAGTTMYTTGMGSNNLTLTSNTGARQGLINVGQGPTGIVLNETNGRAFVLNRFDATISTINLGAQTQAFVTPLQYDPTPAVIKTGRPLLYDTHLNSGLGQLSCGSCHVDGRTDRLAWDLGNPAGSVVTNSQGISFHPMKGPLLTMTLVDMIQAPFLHWRGDRQLDDFEDAFQTLQGGDAPQTDAAMAQMQQFMGTITLPPNPYRNLDNSYSTSVHMPGPNNGVYITGNAVLGAQEFESGCRSCHTGETNRGAAFITGNSDFGVGARNPPTWKNFYKRIGLWYTDPTASTVGFGTQQDGTFDSSQNQTRDADMYAFMMSFNGGYPYEPAGLNQSNWSNNTHAAVGKQVTLSPGNPTDTTGLLNQLVTLAGQGAIGLVAKGGPIGSPVRGWMYVGNNLWQSDHLAEVDSTATLTANVASTTAMTFTAVPAESAVRVGIDMDSDGILDADDPNPSAPNATVANLALTGSATGASGGSSPSLAIDGSTMGYNDQGSVYVAGTTPGSNSWWQVDLGTAAQISLIQLFNRWDCCASNLTDVSVFISQAPFTSTNITATRNQPGVQEFFLENAMGLLGQIPMSTQGRYVRVELNDTVNPVSLAEVRVMGYAVGSFANPGNQATPTGAAVNLPLAFTNTTANSYSFTAANLPPGLSINSSTGAISGTPTTPGVYPVAVTATGAGNPSISFNWSIAQASSQFTLKAPQPTLILAPDSGGYVAVNVSPAAGFTGSVNFTLSGAPASVSAALTPTSSISGTSLVVWVPAGTTGGTYPMTVTGTSGSSSAFAVVTLVVAQSQSITFPAIPAQTVGATYTLNATASSDMDVSYASLTPGVCSVSVVTVTTLSPGTCTITATQAGNTSYAPASASQSFPVAISTAPVPVNLSPFFNVDGISNNGVAPTGGGFDGGSYAYSANALGQSLTALGVPFTLGPAGAVDATANTTIAIPAGAFSSLNFLAAGVFGSYTNQSFVLTFTDGTTSTYTQSISDWCQPQNYTQETVATAMTYRVTPSGGTQNSPCNAYAYSIPIPSGKTVQSFTLPPSRNVVVLAVTMAPTSVSAASPVNLASAFNVWSTFNNGVAPTHGGFDGSSYAYSENLLGRSLTALGVPFTLGSAGAADAIANTTIAIPAGNYTSLNFLAAGAYGSYTSQSFVLTFTDGTIGTYTQSISDWCQPQNYPGETIASAMTYRVSPSGATQNLACNLYAYSIPIPSGKTVKSFTTPSNSSVIVLAVTMAPPVIYQVNLSSAFNVWGVFNNGVAPTNGGFDGGNYAYSGNLLGTSLTALGVNFTLGSPGVADAVANKAIAIPAGTYSSLNFLAAAANGSHPNQNFTLTYTDGTTGTFTQSLSDWGQAGDYPGEAIAATMGYRLVPGGTIGGGPFYLYAYSIPVAAGKVVKTFMPPSTSNVVVLAVTMAQGVATPTFLPAPGTYASAQTVTISDTAPGATIYYTTNGTTPTTSSAVYTGPVSVPASETLQAVAVVNGLSSSALGSAAYTITPASGSQTITFATIAAQTAGTSLTLTATASSGLAVSYSSSTAAVCTVSGATVTFLAAGSCSITASQPGNATYDAAPTVSQSVTVAPPPAAPVSLSSAFNIYGIFKDGAAPTNGGLDTSSYAFSSTLLGTTLNALGVNFNLGPAGAADATCGTAIPVPSGHYSALNFLATATYGSQASQKFVLTYSDGTTGTFTQSLSDWGNPQSYAGETIGATMAYRLTPSGGTNGGGPYYLYAYSLPIPAGKVVKSIQLPASRNVAVFAVTMAP